MDPRSVTIPALLQRVKAASCTVTLAGDRLRLAAPCPLPASLLEALRARKPEIVTHLQARVDLAVCPCKERAALRDHDGGEAPPHAEKAALDEAIPDADGDIHIEAPNHRKRPATGKLERELLLSTVDNVPHNPLKSRYTGNVAGDPPSISTNSTPRSLAARIVLDGEGLPFTACAGCGGGDFWKPATLPLEGEGWRCIACDTPEPDRWRHAVSVPVTVRP